MFPFKFHRQLVGLAILWAAALPGCTTEEEPVAATTIVADDLSVGTDEDKPIGAAFETRGAEPTGFKLRGWPKHGKVKLTADGFVYTPEADYHGKDSFVYEAGSDVGTDEAAVSITIAPVNDAPAATGENTLTLLEDETATAALTAEDADGDRLTFEAVAGPASGALTLEADGAYTYVPDGNWNGVDSFTYRVSDGEADSKTQRVTITVMAVNDLPSAGIVVYAGNEFFGGAPITVLPPMLWSDADGDPAGYLYRWEVDGVTVPVAAATLPATYVTKNAQIRAVVTPFDGFAAGADVAGSLITVKNTTPSAAALNVTTDEDTAVNASFAGSDPDAGDVLTYQVVTGPVHGSLSYPAAGALQYTPNADWNGADSFAYRVSDGTAWSGVATANVTVLPVNDKPSFFMVVNSNQVLAPSAGITIQAWAIDKESDPLTFSWMANGVTIATGSTYTITAPAEPGSKTELTIRVSDGAAYADSLGRVYSAGTSVAGVAVAPAAAANTWTLTAETLNYTGAAVDAIWWRIAGTVTGTGASIAFHSPGIAGIYQIEVAVTDATGYTGWFTAATALTSPTEWAGWGNDLQSTGQHLWAEGLGAGLLPAPIDTTGSVVYEVFIETDIHTPLSLSADGVLLGERWPDGFYARRATDGAALWSFDTFTYAPKPSISSGGTGYFASNGGQLRAMRSADGFLYWTATPGSGSSREIAIGADGRLFSSSDNVKAFRALNPADGTALWTLDTSPNILATSAVVGAGGHIYVGAGSTLYSVYAGGTTQWTLAFPQRLTGIALGGDGTVYAGGLDDTLYAVAPTGAVVWSLNVGQDVNPPKIGPDGTIYVKTTNGNLTAVSPAGAWKWKYDCLGTHSPAIGPDGTIYLSTYGELVALRPTGAVKWRLQRPGVNFGAPVVDAEGYVYVATGAGYLYKLK